jgi:hypothetical protein
MGAYMLSGMTRGELAAYTDIAAYIEQRGTIEGIEDLRPASAARTPYLRSLEEDEWKIPPPPRGRLRQLQIYWIGGIAPAGNLRQGPLKRRVERYYSHWYSYYLGEANHDLVVSLASATATNDEQIAHIDCDHFSYFTDDSPASEAVTGAISLIWNTTGLLDQIVGRPFRDAIEELTKLSTEMKNVHLRSDERKTTEHIHPIQRRFTRSMEAIFYLQLKDALRKFDRMVGSIVEAEGSRVEIPEAE